MLNEPCLLARALLGLACLFSGGTLVSCSRNAPPLNPYETNPYTGAPYGKSPLGPPAPGSLPEGQPPPPGANPNAMPPTYPGAAPPTYPGAAPPTYPGAAPPGALVPPTTTMPPPGPPAPYANPGLPPPPGTNASPPYSTFNWPDWDNPGTVHQQQQRALVHDPYGDNDAGPEIVGGRPRDFQKPLAQPVRSNPWAGFW